MSDQNPDEALKSGDPAGPKFFDNAGVHPPAPPPSNVVALNQPPDPNKAVIAEVERSLPERVALQRMIATTLKARYDGFIEAGFTAEQAMNLIKGVNPLKD